MSDEYELIEPANRNLLLGLLQLMRLPNIFTAMADVAMGFFFVHGDASIADFGNLGLLLAASGMLYVGGMVLNDVVDRKLDAVERPNRPLPSGRVSLKAACILSVILLLGGTALGWTVSINIGKILPGVMASSLLACILLYDAVMKPTPLGPVAMGGCRMLNVLLGMSVIAGPLVAANWLVAGGIGLYITGVTWFARTEATRSKRPPLAMAATLMALGIAMIAWTPRWIPQEWITSKEAWLIVKQQPIQWYLLIFAIGMMIGWRVIVAIVKPDAVRVQRAVGYAVLLLIMLDGAACFVLRGPVYAIAIWTLLFPAMFISRRISPT